MSVSLTGYSVVRSALFVRIQVDEYRTSGSASYANEVLRFSDHNLSFAIDGESYIPLGNLLDIGRSQSELRPTRNTVTITLSGMPTNAIEEIMYSKIKGAPVKIYRAFFNNSTGAQIGTTQIRYIGAVNNYNIDEDIDPIDKTATSTIQLECLSNVEVLQRKTSGRRTNPASMNKFYPNDTSFDRVPSLVNSNFDFGAPR